MVKVSPAAGRAGGGFLVKMAGKLFRSAGRTGGRATPRAGTFIARQRSRIDDVRQAFRRNRRRTQGGESFYAKDDPGTKHAARTLPADAQRRFTIDMHGDSRQVFIGNRGFSAGDLASYLRSGDSRWNGGDIRLMSCETGQGANPFAQQLADRLGVNVRAPDQLAWSDATGQDFVSSARLDANGNYLLDSYGDMIPTWPPDGNWIDFSPGRP